MFKTIIVQTDDRARYVRLYPDGKVEHGNLSDLVPKEAQDKMSDVLAAVREAPGKPEEPKPEPEKPGAGRIGAGG